MAEYREYLAILDSDPTNDQALAALEKLVPVLTSVEAATALDATREALRERGKLEVVERLFDVEIKAAPDTGRLAELLRKKGQLYVDDFLNEKSAVECFRRVLELVPDDTDAQEVLAHLDLLRENWKKVVKKYLDEAKSSTDRQLTTALYLSAAETTARYESTSPQVQEYLRRALDVDPTNRRAATHLERLLRSSASWSDLAKLLEARVESAATTDERVDALVALADLARSHLDRRDLAIECMKKVVTLDPSQPRALSFLSDEYQKEQNWSALVMLYTNALKARRRGSGAEVEVGTLLQIAMLHWKRLGNPDAAEEYFRRIRKVDPSHPAALEFYREYLRARGDANQLVQIYRQAHKAAPEGDAARKRQLSVAIAEISEVDLANPEKAIEAWKAIHRADPDNAEAREALRRLYARAEKWNALLDLIKEEIERRPPGDVAGRIAGLLQVVAIYRDHIKVAGDVMAINTYNAILALDPHHREAIDALAERYKHSGRWNDLISVLARKAELPGVPPEQKVEILREMASLWIERFGNYAQAVGPLEQLLDLDPGDRAAITSLKDIYGRRRQWRALIALYGREAATLPVAERRRHLVEMAHLAAERLGDSRLAIEIWNRVLELAGEGAGGDTGEALSALATLYEKDKRYLALADVYRRQHEIARTPAESVQVLERLGALFAERLRATAPAADIYQQILKIDRAHPRAARILRELYSQSGDYDALQTVYAQLGQWDELVEGFHNIADRVDDRTVKLDLLERAARVAAEHSSNQERVARAWERVLGVDGKNLAAARALVPIYARTGKSARLLAVYEILLDHAEDDDRRLQLLGEIRSLCEDRLGSKVLAFQWAARAYQLRPGDAKLLADLERLGAEADAWDEVATLLDERVKSSEVSREERLGVLRELGKIASVRLHQADRAQQYWEKILAELPEDREAMAALEEIATHQAHWPDLLRIYRRRVDLEPDRDKQIDLLFRIAFLEEERLADLDAAVATYRRIIELDNASRRALKALGKLSEARGDWAGMADVLERDLALTAEVDVKVQLLLRLGGLQENNLGQPDRALDSYKKALAMSPSAHIHRLLERFLTESWPSEVRRDVASLLLPAYEQADDAERMARAIEILRAGESGQTRLERDRRLVQLYGQRLDRPDQAYQAALRVLEADPARAEIRDELARLAELTGMTGDYADHLELVLDMVEETQGAPAFDPEVRRALAADLAEICVDRLVDMERAERAWRKVLAIDESDQGALAGLERIYRTTGRWADLRGLCEEQLEHTLDNARRIDLLFAIADLGETMLGDTNGAVAAYQRVLDVDPALMRAYKALERLYEGNNRWAELEELLTREQEHLGEREAQIPVMVRRARIRAEKLGNKNGALDLLEEVIARQRGNADARELVEELLTDPGERLRVARLLEPLYQEDGLWRDLCLVLRAQREFATSREEASELYARVAQIEEEKLGHERGAFDTWRDVMALLPADERARQHVIRLAAGLDVWDEAVIGLEKALSEIGPDDVAARTAILRDVANIAEDELRDAAQAQSAYRRLLDADPGNPETARLAAQALDRLYVESGDWRALIDIVRRQADWADPGPERLGFLTRLAVLEEERANNPRAAVVAWREVLNEDAEDRPALDALERLYQQGGAVVELADIIRRRVELASEPADKKLNLVRLARLSERELSNPQEAVSAWLEVLDFLPEDVESLDELARLYRTGARHADLLEILERRLMISRDPRERQALTFELGELLSVHLGRDAEALEHYADVLAHEGTHAGALGRVEGMLADEDLRLRAADVLLPLYEKQNEWAKLAALLVRVADAVGDPRSRLRHLRRVAEIRETRLGDRAGALAAYKDAVVAAVAEPDLRDLLRELERVAADEGRLGDLIDVYQEIAPDVFDGELQRRLHLDIADLARGVRRDDALARRYYQQVLEAQPDDRRALDAVEGIYRDAGDHDALYEALLRKAELAGDDLEARAEALAMAASLCQEQLGRPVDAMVVWEQVLELLPDSREAAEALEGLYQQAERWHDLTDLIERRLGFAFTVEEAVRLRYRLGQICEIHLRDPDRAVENYSAALGGDPAHADATGALERFLDDAGTRAEAAEVLEPIYVSHQNWPRLVRIYEIKLEGATDPAERLQLQRYIARLHEDQLEDLEGAFRWYGRVFKENPGEPGLRSQLVRLAGVLDSWAALAHIYQEFLDDTPGDSPESQEVALALAELADRRLGEVERAHAAYRRVLASQPDDQATFGRLETMLMRAQRWIELVDAYQDAIQASLDDRRRIELYARMAEIYESRLGDVARAVDCHRAALDIDPVHAESLAELDRLYQTQKQWFELAELLVGRIEREDDPADANLLRLRLADVLENRMNDPEGAIDQYEKVLKDGGDGTALSALERLVVVERHRQRIAGILEPIYRANDWWRKLVVILSAQLDYTEDPRDKVATLREIAEIHENRGGALSLALDALSRAWLEDTGDDDVYQPLVALTAKLGAWDALVATLEKGLTELYDIDRIVIILRRMAEVEERSRNDRPAAIAALRRLLEQREDDQEALASLDRLLEAEGRHPELVEVVARRADLADDDRARHDLLERVAVLHEQALAQPREAISAWRSVLNVDEGDRRALDALERLYRAQREPRELTGILTRKIELSESPGAARGLRFAAAEVFERELKEPFEAISQMRAVLEADPEDRDALAALDRLYQEEESWPDLLDILDRRAALEGGWERAELMHRAALVVAERLLESDHAIERLRALLAEARAHEGARGTLDEMTRDEDTLLAASDVLEEVYRGESAHDHLAELYERRLASSVLEPDDRAGQLASLAGLHEVQRGDLDAAFAVWARALREDPEDEAVQGHLERLAEARGAWAQLVELYEAMLAQAMAPELEFTYATKLARIQEEALGDLDTAAEKYRRALDAAGDERGTLDALARIYERSGRNSDLAEILSRQAQAHLDEAVQAGILFRLGDVREERLHDVEGAVEAYREVLERDPAHGAARAALERLVANEDVRGQVVAILEPVYESERDDERLADLLVTKLSVTREASDRAQIYARVCELAETRLNDPVRALDAAGGWVLEDPVSEQALFELERLAEATGRWGEMVARLRGIVSASGSQSVKLPLLAKLGAVQLDRERDLAGAEQTFRQVLELDPESSQSLASLERIYRSRGDDAALAGVQWRRAELAFDAVEQRAFRAEVADLREKLGDAAGAIEAWSAVLELDEGDREALARAGSIYERHQQWPELIETLEAAARFARDAEEERHLKERVADLWDSRVGDLDQAATAWQAVFDLDPGYPRALDALEDVHRRRKDWQAVQDVLTRRLDFADRDEDKIAVYERMAVVAEVERGYLDNAIAYLQQILDIDRGNLRAFGELERLLGGAQRWHELVELYERRAQAAADRGNTDEEVRALAKAADVWEGPLGDADAAGEQLVKILALRPDFVPALTRLARIYEAAGEWDRSQEMLEKALALGPRGSDAADLHVRLGESARHRAEEDGTGDEGPAMEHFLEALRHDPAHQEAIAAAEGVAWRRGDWALVADLKERRYAGLSNKDEKLALALELGTLWSEKLSQPARALPLLEEAVRAAPSDPRAMAPLADLYLASGRHKEAAPLYERLAEEAKKSRQMKDVARYRQRLGQLYRAAGDAARALAAYEEAFRIDPTNVATMVGLGRLYVEAREWEKAKRVYRSLVLQKIDPSVGITMGEAYYQLGTIHVQTGERDKAKGMFQRALDMEPQNAVFRQALTTL